MQTKIKITEKNLAKIAAFLDSVQGSRAAVRLVSAADIISAAATAEKRLAKLFSGKKYFPGAKYHGGEYGRFPKAYKYTPIGTTFDISRGPSGWFLVAVSRENCTGDNHFDFTEEQQEFIKRSALLDARRG